MLIKTAYRKLNSAIYLGNLGLRSALKRLSIRISANDVAVGRDVVIGRHVKIRTTDGGRISIGDRVTIDDFAVLSAQFGEIVIGDDGYVGPGVHIVSGESIRIGKDALIAAYCVIRDCNHGMAPGKPMNRQLQTSAPVSIGDDVWLGAHVVVTAGATIGSGAVVGANAVVTKELAAGVIGGGIPVRELKKRG